MLFEDDGRLVKKIAGYHQFHAVRSAIQQVVTARARMATARAVWSGTRRAPAKASP